MIKTKKDLRYYIKEDGKRNGCYPYLNYLINSILGLENAWAFRYIRCMRKCEFHLNNYNESLFHKFTYWCYYVKLSRLGRKYMIQITPNTCGYGLRLIHLTGGVFC